MTKKPKQPEVVKDYLTTHPLYIILALTIFGAILRFYNLASNSLWLDEASTLAMSRLNVTEIWNTGFLDNNPPLFHYLTHAMLIFGNSEFVLRFLPVIFGIATIPLFYLIGKEIKDSNVGLISAALVTFSPFALNYAQEAYSYSMVLFVSSLLIWRFLIAMRTRDLKDWVIVGLCAALCFWTHFYTIVLIGLLYAYIFIDNILSGRIKSLDNNILSGIAALILISPLIDMVIYRFTSLSSHAVTYGTLGFSLVPETLYRFSGFNAWVEILYTILFIIGLLYMAITNRKMAILSALIIFVTIIFSVIISSKMTMNPRYIIYLLPFVFVVIASGYPLIEKFTRYNRLIMFAIALIMVINVAALNNYYTQPRSEDWRGYSEKLYAATQTGDIVVAMPGYISTPLNYYYNNATDGTIEAYADTTAEIETIMSQKNGHNIYFVVTGDISAVNPEGDVVQWLNTKSKALGQYIGIYTFFA